MYSEIRKILSNSCLSEDNNGCKYDGNCYAHENAKIEELIAKHDSELLDKVADRIKAKINVIFDEPNYQHDGETWQNGLIIASDSLDEVIDKMKAEIEE